MNNCIDFKTCSPSTFYDSIIVGGESAAEAVYFLIKDRLSLALTHIYELYGGGFQDEYEDTIDDFFLYLHDSSACNESRPFAILDSVREKKAFFSWVISTYRIFLLNKQREEARSLFVTRVFDADNIADEAHVDENTTSILATAIAYADQQLRTRNRFIFYRLILSLLDHSLAIPQEAMAEALNMHPVTYRVCTKRQKDRFLSYIKDLEDGIVLDLDEKHQMMRDNIVLCFDQLYEVLIDFYNQALTDLPGTDKVYSLRVRYSQGHNSMMHESRPHYGMSGLSILDFFKKQGVGWD